MTQSTPEDFTERSEKAKTTDLNVNWSFMEPHKEATELKAICGRRATPLWHVVKSK